MKDPLGGFKDGLYLEDFAKMAKVFMATGKDLLFLQEGGYALWDISKIALSFFGVIDSKEMPVDDYVYDNEFKTPSPPPPKKEEAPKLAVAASNPDDSTTITADVEKNATVVEKESFGSI